MGGKSRKTGQVSRRLIERLKGDKALKNAKKKLAEKAGGGLDLDGSGKK